MENKVFPPGGEKKPKPNHTATVNGLIKLDNGRVSPPQQGIDIRPEVYEFHNLVFKKIPQFKKILFSYLYFKR